MASMFSKIKKEEAEVEEKRPTILDILEIDDPRYYIIIEDGKILTCGYIDDILRDLPEGYQTKETKLHYYDPARGSMKVVF